MQKKLKDNNQLRHIAIIMDGNGRWAKSRGQMRIEGHRQGVNATYNIVRYAGEQGLNCLSLFAFSSENWTRPKTEVSFLFSLFVKTLNKYINEFHENNIKLVFSGERSALPKKLYATLEEAEKLTYDNSGMILNIAFNYGGRWDITQAAKKMTEACLANQHAVGEISEDLLASYLDKPSLPDPDLLIRTSGEHRISNFFLWQAAYSELYFTDVLWPDFSTDEFDKAIDWYLTRDRRYGGLNTDTRC
jgi:undecaprenyl diphosphate synthase